MVSTIRAWAFRRDAIVVGNFTSSRLVGRAINAEQVTGVDAPYGDDTMKAVANEWTKDILGAPSNWNAERDGPCLGLPVLIERDDGGLKCFYSYWRTTWRERLAILFGRPVRLVVTGMHPPVHIDTEPH